jgi:hypothetical protein
MKQVGVGAPPNFASAIPQLLHDAYENAVNYIASVAGGSLPSSTQIQNGSYNATKINAQGIFPNSQSGPLEAVASAAANLAAYWAWVNAAYAASPDASVPQVPGGSGAYGPKEAFNSFAAAVTSPSAVTSATTIESAVWAILQSAGYTSYVIANRSLQAGITLSPANQPDYVYLTQAFGAFIVSVDAQPASAFGTLPTATPMPTTTTPPTIQLPGPSTPPVTTTTVTPTTPTTPVTPVTPVTPASSISPWWYAAGAAGVVGIGAYAVHARNAAAP